MAVPASDLWIKIQKDLAGKTNSEQIAIVERYLHDWPDEWKGPYQELKERLVKLLRKLQTTESIKSSSAREDPFHVPRSGDAQVAFLGLTNSGKSALVATLTNAHLEVSDYPFTTQVPGPGMLRHKGAAIQLVDTPAIVPGLAGGAGPGQRLVQLIRAADAIAIVVDLAQEPLEQMKVVCRELAAANVVLLPRPVRTVLEPKGKGGIKFRGAGITKGERIAASRMLAEHGVVHAEVIIRSEFSPDELAAGLARRRLMPALIVGNKNDVPGAGDALALLRAHYAEYVVVDVNFLDEANFDQLRTSVFDILGLVRVYVLERPAADAPRTTLILPRSTSIGDVLDRVRPARNEQVPLARAWGLSVKYPGQSVGLEHLVDDGDLIHLQF